MSKMRVALGGIVWKVKENMELENSIETSCVKCLENMVQPTKQQVKYGTRK